jgi:sigma-B regulation protein RsbU (phosphoserine phosphatase)
MQNSHALGDEVEILRRRIGELEQTLAETRERLRWKRDLAARVQRSLMPHPFRDPRIWVDFRYQPIEEVGGDYCQVRFSDRHRLYLTISDVTGHGVGPALLAASVSSEVRYSILYGRAPHEVVRSLNAMICDHFSAANLYLTFFVACVDLADRTITWSGAGHPSPLLIRRGGQSVHTLDSQNPMIGITRDLLSETPEQTLPLGVGDRLFFYTDGLSETSNALGRTLGTRGLANMALTLESLDLFAVADQILAEISEYEYGRPNDDKTLLVAELR